MNSSPRSNSHHARHSRTTEEERVMVQGLLYGATGAGGGGFFGENQDSNHPSKSLTSTTQLTHYSHQTRQRETGCDLESDVAMAVQAINGASSHHSKTIGKEIVSSESNIEIGSPPGHKQAGLPLQGDFIGSHNLMSSIDQPNAYTNQGETITGTHNRQQSLHMGGGAANGGSQGGSSRDQHFASASSIVMKQQSVNGAFSNNNYGGGPPGVGNAAGVGNSILANAGQLAASSMSQQQQHHSIPIRTGSSINAAQVHQPNGGTLRGVQPPNQNNQSTAVSQQQMQQQQYKIARTQMYEKMLIQQQLPPRPGDSKQALFTNSGINGATATGSGFNQAQMAAAQALSQQQQFLNNQGSFSTAAAQQQQAASLLFPRIGNVRNDLNGGSNTLYKTSGGTNGGVQVGQGSASSTYQPSHITSPFLQTQKQGALISGINVTSFHNGQGGNGVGTGLLVGSNMASKKKTVSPRNVNTAFPQDGSAGRAVQGTDDHHQYTLSLLDSSESKANQRNRMKSNHAQPPNGGKREQHNAHHAIEEGNGYSHPMVKKDYYNTEKLGTQLLMNSDSRAALQRIDEQGANLRNQNQFYVGEVNVAANGPENIHIKRLASEESSTLYQQQQASTMTPSLLSSHSNKRQSHQVTMFNQNQPIYIQKHIQQNGVSASGDQTHNFFARRTVSNKDQHNQVSKHPQSIPLQSTHSNFPLQAQPGQDSIPSVQQQFQMPNAPFSPGATSSIHPSQYNSAHQRGGMMVDGTHMQVTNITDQRMKLVMSVAGMRASHDNSPVKQPALSNQITVYQGSQGANHIQEQLGQPQSTNGTNNIGQPADPQQPVKIPVICGFHKRVLLLTSQITTQGGPNQPGLPMTGAQQATRESINKKIRNRNPNCNHNNNSVFYAPCYNNVKYDDSYKKKEEVLRKVFFKECAREDDKRNHSQQPYFPGGQIGGANGAQSNQLQKNNDPFTYLKPIENFLMSSLFVEYDNQQAAKLNPNLTPPRVTHTEGSLFNELGLEQAIVAHKAFLLALIQSGKITNENMLKVLHEFKQSALDFDHECIYCKYSQYALRESTKVIRNSLKAAAQSSEEGANNLEGALSPGNTVALTSANIFLSESSNGQDLRIDYLIRMFQSQLFKRSFINTSLMIIQRKMNEKLLQKQRLPPGVNGKQTGNGGNGPGGDNGKAKKPLKPNDKKPTAPMSSLDWIAAQMQKLAKNLSNPKDKDKFFELKERYYREFLMKINQSNNAIIPFPKQAFTPYKYYIGRGNNSLLVRNCLKQRFWWSMGDFEEWDEYNFIWTQWKTNKIIAKIKPNQEVQAANSDQSTKAKSGLSSKEGGSDSMLSTDRDSNSSAETLLATPTKRKRVATALQTSQQGMMPQIKKAITSASKTNVVVTAPSGKPGEAPGAGEPKEKKETSHNFITYNHMENNYHLSNKKALYYNMKIYYESIGQDWCSVLPLTFHIKEGPGDKEFQRFMEVFKDYDSGGKAGGNFEKLGKQIWIVKPGENTNRGCGIQVCRELQQIKDIVSNTHINGQKRSYIIQKYIEKPLLYKNRKFDIRCYTLMTTVNGNLQGYWYNEGYLRTSSKDFNLKNVTNRLIHLTNDAVQKKSDDYGKFESGNKLSYPEFQKYLDSIDIKCNVVKDIVPQLKKMAQDTIRACSRKVDPHRRHNTFEIFGYDFMIDEDLKPWLIEVNTNPCLELSAPYLSRLIPQMIENAVKIAVDPLFPPPPWPNSKKHTIPDCAESNRFELVFNELTDAAELKSLPIDDLAMNGIIEEEEMEDEGSDGDDGDDYIA